MPMIQADRELRGYIVLKMPQGIHEGGRGVTRRGKRISRLNSTNDQTDIVNGCLNWWAPPFVLAVSADWALVTAFSASNTAQ